MAVEHSDQADRQVDLFREFLEHYDRSETKEAVERFCRGIYGGARDEA